MCAQNQSGGWKKVVQTFKKKPEKKTQNTHESWLDVALMTGGIEYFLQTVWNNFMKKIK